MDSIRRKFYVTYLLITAAGAIGLRSSAEHFRSLPTFYGIDIYSALLGVVYLIISVFLLEFFVFTRIRYLNNNMKELKEKGYTSSSKILNLSKKDEIGQIVHQINETIEELHNKTERLEFKKALYVSLVNDPSIFVYRFKEGGEITFINNTYATALGGNHKEMLGQNIFDYLTDAEELKRKLVCLNPINASSEISLDMPKVVNEKIPKWIAWNACAIFDHAGRVVEYQLLGVNMHHSQQEETKKIGEYDNVFLVSTTGKIAYISSITNYENVVGQNFIECLHQEDVLPFQAAFEYVIRSKKSAVRNVRFKNLDKVIPAQILIEASLDRDEVVNSLSIKMVDITDIEGAQARVMGAVNNMNRLLEKASYI